MTDRQSLHGDTAILIDHTGSNLCDLDLITNLIDLLETMREESAFTPL